MAVRLDKRVARLAVTRFGADPARVRRAYLDALQAHKHGDRVDLVEVFLRAKVINESQAAELREALDRTQIDPRAPSKLPRNSPDATFEVTVEPPAPKEAREPPQRLQSIVEYRVLRKLGEGGMGEVYLAFDESAERLVAIKVLWTHLASNPALVERFRREAEHARLLDHPNVVRGYGYGVDPRLGRHYLVMEYVDGPSVQKLLDKHAKLNINDAVHVALDVAHALEHAHTRNIIHRDIKPENILITRSGVAKLADLGLSKATDQVSHLTATRQGFGTPYYMPYEQAMNAKSADGRSDIYALGATLYHMVTGQLPFQGESQVDILEKKEAGIYPPASLVNPLIPLELDRILDKMLARDRRDRYQTASELIVDLQRSNLSAPLLSFVDRDAAMQDPVVRARAALAHQATLPDLNTAKPEKTAGPTLWYVRYHDLAGHIQEVKLTTEQVLQRIGQGRLNGAAQASTSPDGEYRLLKDFAAFAEAVQKSETRPAVRAEPDEAPAPPAEEEGPPAWQGWFIAGSAVILLVVVLWLVYLLAFAS